MSRWINRCLFFPNRRPRQSRLKQPRPPQYLDRVVPATVVVQEENHDLEMLLQQWLDSVLPRVTLPGEDREDGEDEASCCMSRPRRDHHMSRTRQVRDPILLPFDLVKPQILKTLDQKKGIFCCEFPCVV